jgi:hypothetical protein
MTMHVMRNRVISRRTMLRGAVAGTSFAIGLPILEAMLDRNGEAFAGGEPLPRRFVTWLVANGVLLSRFEPDDVGASWSLSQQLDAFAGVKDYMNLCTGYANHGADEGYLVGHVEGMTVFTGHRAGFGGFGYDAGGPSIDQLVADSIGDATPVRSMQVAVSKANIFAGQGTLGNAISFRGSPGQLTPLPPNASPKAVWESIFGIFPSDDAPEDDRIVRAMMLDGVRNQANGLRDKVGTADRQRIDAHLQGVDELAVKISALPPTCVMPDEPIEENAEPIGSEQVGLIGTIMSELVAYALRCDITRVASVQFLGLAGETPYPEAGVSSTKHILSHEAQYNVGSRELLHQAIMFEMSKLAEFAQILRDSVEAGGTNLLDSTIVYASSDCSVGWLHSVSRQPVILLGTGGGHLQYPGVHSQAIANDPSDPDGEQTPNMPTAGNTSDIALACLQAYAPNATSFGGGVCASDTPLADILA